MLGSDKRREGARAKAQFFVGRFFRGLKAAIPGLKSGASTRRAKAQFFVGRFFRGLKAAIPGLKSGASTGSPRLLPRSGASTAVRAFALVGFGLKCGEYSDDVGE